MPRRSAASLAAAAMLALSGSAHAFVQADLDKLETTGSCVDCDLSGAMLTGKVKPQADLSGANLTDAFFEEEDLTGVKLCNTIMADGRTDNRDC
ncbi:pentapeptide repeat protein [Hoeflea marina]|uniref:Pentapeptide repeat protein n=1 Tax=Hoeflea marina TaxID=274592 RepID=A0A317PTC5_9HYPH|nr:pentapeptide repeat-containing protein [Hoeflea marina]PWW04187.1 pentapeptide repeat protein [Hoeflea marina]